MKDLLEKLSSYNIFNYLLPGIVYVVLVERLTSFSFVQQDLVLGVFLYYFIGLIISRIGSIIIEPLFKWAKIVKFSLYSDYISASKKDETLIILSEANNMYRTFCSLFICLIVIKIYEMIISKYPLLGEWTSEITIVSLMVLFCLSYRKQTHYITKRIQRANERD